MRTCGLISRVGAAGRAPTCLKCQGVGVGVGGVMALRRMRVTGTVTCMTRRRVVVVVAWVGVG